MSPIAKTALTVAAVSALLFVATLTVEVEHRLELESGSQSYERSIFGMVIESMSERNIRDCLNWTNPRPGQSGIVVLSRCTVLGCDEFESTEVMLRCDY
ncbi:MAG: hypothetical protein AAGF57_01735 [Pseudomonadota bacterium]